MSSYVNIFEGNLVFTCYCWILLDFLIYNTAFGLTVILSKQRELFYLIGTQGKTLK